MNQKIEAQKNAAIRGMTRDLRSLERIRQTTPLYGAAHRYLHQAIIALDKAIDAEIRCRPKTVKDAAKHKKPVATSPLLTHPVPQKAEPHWAEVIEIDLLRTITDLGHNFQLGDVQNALASISALGDSAPWVLTKDGDAYEVCPEPMKSVVKTPDGESIAFYRIRGIGVRHAE
ncbi:hypothetical protein I4J05_06740 [Corynebacterium diphtheriae bv. mitis]|uniref:hypothetical protein n=1 Tax=Corynebacterium diphtheriae TaxID=1717 RepID=UPI0013CC83B5|nr:hypothetical protein [Corynebacterium diphtheriae]MBG9274773.1 hypothetical protein [Corynebacterium diphtheriae bv. mitis]CAB0507503.1 hypothetical protein CIP103987_01129 [Corynebacterium diphtheriae]CAB0552150.1 hypothetical protein CIP107526_01125 [Corynebacterium diphtheriae]CAB0690518.1 hypothetical protein FRC0026_00929 [Corynebacterium diphtheriae]CAB0776668.1 hypothetical protein FRC0151_01803 [Corynebacterium diphtheriae]